ncbi:hypothetical protein QTP70_028898 [Hemibagrus guttatus]|uniref:Nucleolar pre-ribosomal-associated protein 1 n=1 Tax=Hemibagrus guttatus TaxID=175788 RepID=A0AAE0UQ64_9TELE|nr:hypothetical protein QTP70_028898 [Hemibagrus guttatus]
MANKRQNKNFTSLIPEKKAKENANEFNGTVFKSMLKDPSKAFKALETFIQTAKKLPCDNLYDVVEGYLKISAECAEILALLEGDTHSETELMLTFQSLELILLRLASDLTHFNLTGFGIVKKAVSSHMKLLQSSLCSKNRQFVRQCLCLLTAMVSQGTEAACEIFSSLVFNKTLSSLARMRDRSGRPDVRMSYIQFALSFLMYGDTSTILNVLNTKDFLSEILNTGLKEDRISTISLILSTFQTKASLILFNYQAIIKPIVQNTALSKTQKLRFFTASTLTRIASLYKWDGTLDISTDHSVEEGRLVVRESVHSFLLDLCCSRKHGISFHDPSLGTARRAGNIVLLQFVVSLKQATEDEKVAELLVSILKCHPDILHRYFNETQLYFTPRMKGAWLDSVALLKKIYRAQPEVSQAFQLREVVPVPRLLSMVLVTTLPPVCNKAFFTQGLNLPSVVGQHATLTVMAFILRRAQKNIEHSLKQPVLDSFDTHSINYNEEFVQLYMEALSKVLPDIMSIVSRWQSLSKNEKKEDEVQMSLTKLKAEDVKTQEHGDQNQKLILFKALLLQVICLYQKVVPHLVIESKFDFSKLLTGIVPEKGMTEDVPAILQYQLLQLALELPASKFSWFRFQDVVAPEWEGRESILCVLLKMFVNGSNTHLRTTTKMLILKVLMKVVFNPYIYLDKVAVMVQEAVCIQAKVRGQDRNTSCVPISHVDDVPCVMDVIIETSEKDADNTGLSLTDDIILQIFPFSAAVPAVLEARNKQQAAFIDQKRVLCEYMCAVLCDILHTQRDPLALCLTLYNYDAELFSSENFSPPHSSMSVFRMYYFKWLSHLHQETQVSLMQSTTSLPVLDFSAYMKACYCEGPGPFLQDSFWKGLEQTLSTLKLSEFIGAVSQTLLYLKSFVETFCLIPRAQAAEVVGCMLKVLHSLFLKLYSIAETPTTQSAQSASQEEEDFFLDMNITVIQEVNKEQVLLDVFRLVFKHPVLQQWFFALELGVMPSHTLDPERVMQLCGQLTQGVLNLVMSCVETLKALHALEIIGPYLSAIQQALLCELQQSNRCMVEESQTVEAFLTLYEYMDPSSVSEVLSALLLLPQSSLLAGDKMSLYGHAVLTVLTKSISSAYSANINHCLTRGQLHNLAALHSSCYSIQLEHFFLQISPENISDSDWNNFVKSGLKYRYKDRMFLCTLNFLLESMYRSVLTPKGLLPIETLHLMVTSHSLFLPTMLVPEDDTHSSLHSKEALATLLLTLVKKCPEVCKSNHFHVLLGSYGATLSYTDQNILLILKEYEKNNMSLMEFQYLLWGHAAVEYHNTRRSLGPSLWQQLSSEPLLDQLVEDRMLNTVSHFPLHRCLIPQENEELNSIEVKEGFQDEMCLYDPSFLIPLFSYIVRPDAVVDCRKFVCSHALGLTVVALSSYDHKMRAAAYHVLGSFYQHLESVHFKEKKQLLYLLDTLRNAIQKQNLRVSFVHATYIAKVAQQILRPEEHMYLVISKFLLGTQYVDLKRVPDFFRLFYSFDLEHKLEREWLLKVLEEGMRDGLCYELCEKQSIFHTLLGFCSSPVCDQPVQVGCELEEKERFWSELDEVMESIPTGERVVIGTDFNGHVGEGNTGDEEVMGKFGVKERNLEGQMVVDFAKRMDMAVKREEHRVTRVEIQIVNVLWETAHFPKASYDFSKAHGILTWILQFTERRNVDKRMLTIVIGLLHTLWFSNLGKNNSMGQWSSRADMQLNNSGKCLPFSLISDFLCVLLTVIRYLRTGVEPSDMESFLQLLDSVFKHHGTALNDNRDTSWLHPQSLSCSAALTLLHCWGTLASDTKLLSCLQDLFNMYSIKVLHGAWRDEVQGSVQCKDGHTDKYLQSLVKCKTLLLSVLTYWEPCAFLPNKSDQNLNPSTASPSNSSYLDSDKVPSLQTATAHTLISWTLRTLSEMPFDEYIMFATLKWLEKVIVPHENIAKSLMNDEPVRVGLLRLYQQTCEFKVEKKRTLKLDTLHLFTTIMVQLLEVGKTLHRNVIKACLHSTTDDPVKREAGLKLLSLYIPEIWSGAKVPQLLLTHAQLVTRWRKISHKSSTPIMRICEDILTTVILKS